MTSGENNEEATWLDLVANYDAPADIEGGIPWPERENLSAPDNAPIPGASQVTRSPQAPESPQATGPFPVSDAPPGIRPAAPADPARDPGQLRPGERGGPERLSGPPPRNGAGELNVPGERRGPAQEPRPGGPQRATAGPNSQEEHYFPPPPPPLPKLDPLSKGAWVALFGGPAYLLIATAVGWTVPAVAAFLAIGAFVGGFAVLVLRMGDEPRNGSGPDDGAVV